MRLLAEGGWAMYAILGLGSLMLAFCAAHAAVARVWSLIVGVVLIVVVLGLGAVGYQIGRHRMERALSAVAAEYRAAMAARGAQEMALPVRFALLAAAVGVVPLGIGELRRLARRRR